MKNSLLAALTLFICMAGENGSRANAEQMNVAFGGLALATYGESQETLLSTYPVAAKLLLCDNMQLIGSIGCNDIPNGLRSLVSNYFVKNEFQNINVSYDFFSSLDTEGFVLVPVINHESLVSADEGRGYSYAFRVFLDVMLLRFRPGEVQFVASSPYIINYFDITDRKLTTKEIEETFINIYMTENLGVNIFQEAAKDASRKFGSLNEKGNYSQITKITLSDEVENILQQSGPSDSWKQKIGQFLTSQMVDTTSANIIPSKGTDETVNLMSLVFQDGNRKLSLPTPNFQIELDVERFVRHEQTSGSEKLICFIVAVRLKVKDAFDHEKGNIRFVRRENSCGATKLGTNREDKMYFPESLFSLLTGISSQFGSDTNRAFLAEHTEAANATKNQIETLKSLMFR